MGLLMGLGHQRAASVTTWPAAAARAALDLRTCMAQEPTPRGTGGQKLSRKVSAGRRWGGEEQAQRWAHWHSPPGESAMTGSRQEAPFLSNTPHRVLPHREGLPGTGWVGAPLILTQAGRRVLSPDVHRPPPCQRGSQSPQNTSWGGPVPGSGGCQETLIFL